MAIGKPSCHIFRKRCQSLRQKRPNWGPKKLLDVLERREQELNWPSIPTAARILAREALVKPRRRHRRAHPGCPKTRPADYKGQFRLKNGKYCFPLTVSDLSSRYLLGCDAHPTNSLERSQAHFQRLFETYGLPNRIRTDNGVPFASNALARLSQLSVWFIKLGIYPELHSPAPFAGIEPGEPQQNGVHERMHRTLKQEATIPPASSLKGQQRKFDEFQQDFNEERPHEAIDMKRPAERYQPSTRQMPVKLESYDYPGHYLVRRVSRAGTIRAFGRQPFVSSTLIEDYVGLEEAADGVYDLYFCFYQIGRYDVRENRIQDVISKVGVGRQQIDRAERV